MKITREKLKQIIKEELETAMNKEAEGKLTRKDMQMFILKYILRYLLTYV